MERVRSGWKRFRPLMGSKLLPVAVLAVVAVLGGLAEAGLLLLVADVAASMVLHRHSVVTSFGPLSLDLRVGQAVLTALVFAGARFALQVVVAWLPTRLSVDVQARLRRDLFEAYTKASWSVQAGDAEGELQELMSGQTQMVLSGVMNVANALSAGAMFLSLVGSAFSLDPLVALVVLASALVLFAALRPMDQVGRLAARDASQASIDHASGVSESVRLAEEAQVFGAGPAHRRRVGALIDAARRASFRAQLVSRLVQTTYQSLVMVLIVSGLGVLYLSHSRHLAELGAVVLMLVRAAAYGQQFQSANHTLVQTIPYIERLQEAISRYRGSAPGDAGRPMPEIESLGFEEVSFSYVRDRRALDDVSFTVERYETVGIVGRTGAGKSTLAQLLLRLRQPSSGVYLLNNEPVDNFSRAQWQQRVAYVPQEPRVLQGTVAENIRFYRDLDDERVEQSARLAYVHDEIVAMPAGYETPIGQRADAVSGGQRQRLCLARALVGEPELLLLDEPTSALDVVSEAAIQASLAGLHGRVTIFIVAHRVPILSICDRILVLEKGRVQSFASSEELARLDPYFMEMLAVPKATS